MIRKTISAPEMKRRLYRKANPVYANITSMPALIDYRFNNRRMHVTRDRETFTQTDAMEQIVNRRGFGLDGPELLDVFDSLRTPDELLPFLEMCGPFRDRGAARQAISWTEFEQWQELIRSLQDKRSLAFPFPSPFVDSDLMEAIVDPQPETLFYKGAAESFWTIRFSASTALEYLGAAIRIEDMKGSEWIACRLPSCNRRFTRRTSHETFYCVPAHARQHSKWKSRNPEESNAKA